MFHMSEIILQSLSINNLWLKFAGKEVFIKKGDLFEIGISKKRQTLSPDKLE